MSSPLLSHNDVPSPVPLSYIDSSPASCTAKNLPPCCNTLASPSQHSPDGQEDSHNSSSSLALWHVCQQTCGNISISTQQPHPLTSLYKATECDIRALAHGLMCVEDPSPKEGTAKVQSISSTFRALRHIGSHRGHPRPMLPIPSC